MSGKGSGAESEYRSAQRAGKGMAATGRPEGETRSGQREGSPTRAPSAMPRVAVAIFTAREAAPVLSRCVRAAVRACRHLDARVDVLVNGNRALADQIALELRRDPSLAGGVPVRVWYIALADKANAWNVYLHEIWEASRTVCFIDGYTEPAPVAFVALASALAEHPDALGATGVPTMGRSAAALRREMLEHGGIHGNLYAVRDTVMALLRARGFRFPLGLYRIDPLLAALMNVGFDPQRTEWDASRVVVSEHATWTFRPLSWRKWSDVVSVYKRTLRQGQGTLENRALRHRFIVRRRPIEEMPATVAELIDSWRAADSEEAGPLLRRDLLARLAWRKLCKPRRWDGANAAPELVTDSDRAGEAGAAAAAAASARVQGAT